MRLRPSFPALLAVCLSWSLSSSAGSGVPAWPDLSTDAGPQGGGDNDAALVVGVGDYVYLPDIAGAVDNAAAWQQWLLRSRKVRPDRVVLLADREATREKIDKNLKAMAAAVGEGGTMWFIFIGHGAPSASGDDGLLLGVDTDADADSVAGRGLAQKTALSLVGAGRQAHSVVVFDACFSGRTGDGEKTLVPGLQATIPTRRPTSTTKTTVLAASDSFAGPIPGAGRPAFSYLLLGALRGWADDDGDKAVSVDEAFAFSRGAIQALFKGADRLPSMSGGGVVLARNAREERPDIAALIAGRCPTDSRWDGRACKAMPKVQCPAGTTWDGAACASDCPQGTRWEAGVCVAQAVRCPAASVWNGRECVGGAPPSSPPSPPPSFLLSLLSPPSSPSPAPSSPPPSPSSPRPSPTTGRVRVGEVGSRVALAGPVLFLTGKATIDPASHALLDELAAVMRQDTTLAVAIEVHTDATGNERANQRLTDARAAAVVAYLVGQGVDADRVTGRGFGGSRPVADNRSAEGRATNRRVEVRRAR
jgi:outer membrane protein OmpA-like peptidoglycan-associated protein